MTKRKTLIEVVDAFKKVHGDRYDYTQIKEYKNASQKLPIICHEKDENGIEHGVFYQSYSKHFARGHGCPKCAKNGVQYKQEEFEQKINKIFKGKYEVGDVYANAHTPMKFICKKHGDFITKPYYLLQGHGCPACGIEKVSESLKNTKEEIIRNFKKIHGCKYDYSKFEYNGYDTPSIIICHKRGKNKEEHGEFLQTPHSHINGRGCPKCNLSRLEKEISEFLTENKIAHENQKKFEWLGQQRLDFYLPDYNVAIECQGEQHYIPCNFGSKKKTPEEIFLYIREKDLIKKTLCENNNIKLLYYTKCEKAERTANTFSDKIKLLKEILKNGTKQNL